MTAREDGKVLKVISLGAGVQSSTMALMAAHGEIEMPDAAIFADTQSEPRAVYEWLDRLEGYLPYPVYRVTAGDLGATVGGFRPKGKFLRVDIPVFVASNGSVGIINRSCTRDYKIDPIRRKLRELLGITGKRSPKTPIAEQWIGISVDEAMRMKPSREPWIMVRWPLIEKMMSRADCLKWLKDHGYPCPPKSACTFCPFHSDALWRDMKRNDPISFSDAVRVDQRLRAYPPQQYRTKGTLYLHRSCQPLEEVDFRTDRDLGQLDLFGNECEGMCGV